MVGIAHESKNKPLKPSRASVILSDLWRHREHSMLPFHVMALPAQKGDEAFLMRFPPHRLPLVLRKRLAKQIIASVPSDIFHGVLPSAPASAR